MKNVGVVGGGLMGSGIAEVSACAGSRPSGGAGSPSGSAEGTPP